MSISLTGSAVMGQKGHLWMAITQGDSIMPDNQQEIKITFPESNQSGIYSNNSVVGHSGEEFILDFLLVTPPAGRVNARVIISPAHAKRLFKALGENLAQYEKMFGKIKPTQIPPGDIKAQ